MRLINVSTRRLEQFTGPKTPDYAILSHTWGSDADEVTFSEFNNGQCQMKKGFNKIVHLCEEATHRGIGYVWIDTCCIDSSSSAELSEAINSMFRWYEKAIVCFVYLEDYETKDGSNQWEKCRW